VVELRGTQVSIATGNHATGVQATSYDNTVVTFDRDVHDCAFQVTPRGGFPTANAVPVDSDVHEVVVTLTLNGSSFVLGSYSLTVSC